jgi:Fe-S-cluster-containing hydrogenase component 2
MKKGKRGPGTIDGVPYIREGRLCYYCRKPRYHMTEAHRHPQKATRDHVWPRAMGAERQSLETVAACLRCNQAKGCRSPLDPYVVERQWLKGAK